MNRQIRAWRAALVGGAWLLLTTAACQNDAPAPVGTRAPASEAHMVARIEPWGFFIVMGLVIAGVVGAIWLRPLMSLGYGVIDMLLTPLTALLG